MSPSTKDTGRGSPALALGLLVAALVAVRVVAVVLVLRDSAGHSLGILGGDARRYMEILSSGGTPYRDFPVEYPPLTLAFTRLLEGGDLFATQVQLAISQILLELGVAGVLAWAWGRRVAIAFLILGTPMAFYPFPYFRIDLLAVLLAVGAMALVRRSRPAWGGALLGVAAFAKVWPLVLTPWLVLRQAGDRRGIQRSLVALLAVLLAGGLAWVTWAGLDAPVQVVSFRGANGWQVESVVGILLHLSDPAATAVEQGAWRTGAAVPGLAKIALPVLALGTAAGAWALAERARRLGRSDSETLLDGWAPLASVLGLLVFSSIISPQYLLWSTPFVAIVAARLTRSGLLVGGLFLATGSMSALGLAFIEPLTQGELWAGGIVVARNALLVAMLVACFAHLVRSARAPLPPAEDQVTPKAMMAAISAVDATRSMDDVRSGIP